MTLIRPPSLNKLIETYGSPKGAIQHLLDSGYTPEDISRVRIRADDEGVFVKPSILMEVTYQEIQASEEYTSGYALRVPKVVRFKLDKNVDDVDTSEKIAQLYESQYERQRDATTVT